MCFGFPNPSHQDTKTAIRVSYGASRSSCDLHECCPVTYDVIRTSVILIQFSRLPQSAVVAVKAKVCIENKHACVTLTSLSDLCGLQGKKSLRTSWEDSWDFSFSSVSTNSERRLSQSSVCSSATERWTSFFYLEAETIPVRRWWLLNLHLKRQNSS